MQSGKSSRRKISGIFSKKKEDPEKQEKKRQGMCIQPGYDTDRCAFDYQCEHCLCSQMPKKEYLEFLCGLNVPKGV